MAYLPGIILIVFGTAYLSFPLIFQKLFSWSSMSKMPPEQYKRYMRRLGIILVAVGILFCFTGYPL